MSASTQPGLWKVLLGTVLLWLGAMSSRAFEGTVEMTLVQDGHPTALVYTVSSNCVRIAPAMADRWQAVDLVDRTSGWVTIIYPQNSSFVRLPPGWEAGSHRGAAMVMTRPGPESFNGGPARAPRPLELRATGLETNLLGYPCRSYDIVQGGEVMEIWATDRLFPCVLYVPNQPGGLGMHLSERSWGTLLAAKNLFPLAVRVKRVPATPATLAVESYELVAQAITARPIQDTTLFQPPPGYQEAQPLSF